MAVPAGRHHHERTPERFRPSNAPATAQDAKARRRKTLVALAAVVVVAGAGWGLYDWLVLSHYESTDNAYVQGNVIQITPQTGGTVMSIMADDTDFVKAGAPLVQLDPADARVALAQAEAGLAQAVRQARTVYVNNGSLNAQITLRQAEVAKARSDVARAQEDLKRRQSLSGNGAVSKEELQHAQNQVDAAHSALAAAQAGVEAAREQLTSNQSLTQGVPVQENPNVLAAAAKVREAYLAERRTALPAPVDGYVAKRTVQLGQRVAPGAPLMTIVPLSHVWVDANFKENQLRNLRLGQSATLTADLYGSKGGVHGQGRRAGRGHGRGVRAAARAERHRQLDQGGAARARAHRPGCRAAQGPSAARGPVHGRHGEHPGPHRRTAGGRAACRGGGADGRVCRPGQGCRRRSGPHRRSQCRAGPRAGSRTQAH